MCERKVQYTARHVAESAREGLIMKDESFAELEVYACRFCEYYHLGHGDETTHGNTPTEGDRPAV